MNKVTIFSGPQNSGKTYEATRISKERKAFWLCELNYDSIREIPDETDLIIIDEADLESQHVKNFIGSEKLNFRKPYAKTTTTIQRPELIICTNDSEIPADIQQLVTVREFPARK